MRLWHIRVEGNSARRKGVSEESIQGRQRLDKEKKEMRVSKSPAGGGGEYIFDTHLSNAEHVTNRQITPLVTFAGG